MHRTASRLALGAGALAVGAAVVGTGWHVANAGVPYSDGVSDWWSMGLLGGVAFGGTGGWLAAARPSHPLGWLFLGMGLLAGTSLVATEHGLWALEAGRQSAEASLWLGNWLWVAGIVPIVSVVPLLLPNGHLPGAGWRPALLLGVLATVAAAVSFALTPYDSTTPGLVDAGLTNPWHSGWVSGPAAGALLTLTIIAGAVLGVAGLVVRWRRSHDQERQQLKWVLLGVGGAVVFFAAGFVLGPFVSALAMVPVPVAIVVAVLRHGLADVDVVISRSLLYGVLTLCLVTLYVTVVGALGGVLSQVFGSSGSAAVVGTALVAVAAEPLHRRLRRGVNRLVHGDVDEPYAVLARLGDRLAAAASPDDLTDRVLPSVVEQVARSLRAREATLTLRDGLVTSYGASAPGVPGSTLSVDLEYGGERFGTLAVTRAAVFDTGAVDALDRLASQAAVAAHTVLLARESQRAREAVVLAREEERRRLRRDLHDGVGPSLAALALHVETARDLAGEDPSAATRLLDRLVPRMNATVADVRAMVHQLRPPMLDELGLAAAVRELGDRLSSDDTRVRTYTDVRRDLPAAVEVAAYHIAGEATGNAVRHSGAGTVEVRLTDGDGCLRVEVVDDGTGLPEDPSAGLGTFSMRERAEELGGHLDIVTGPSGTRVTALLPKEASS